MHMAFHLNKEKRMKVSKVQGFIGNENTWRLDKKAKSITETEQKESTLPGQGQPVFKINWYHLLPDYK